MLHCQESHWIYGDRQSLRIALDSLVRSVLPKILQALSALEGPSRFWPLWPSFLGSISFGTTRACTGRHNPRAGGKMLLSQAGIGTIHVMGQSLRFWLPLGTGSTIQKRSNYTGWNTSPSTVSDRWDHNHRLSMSEFHGFSISIFNPRMLVEISGLIQSFMFNPSLSVHWNPLILIGYSLPGMTHVSMFYLPRC